MATAALPAPLQPRRRELIFGTAFATAGVVAVMATLIGYYLAARNAGGADWFSANTIPLTQPPPGAQPYPEPQLPSAADGSHLKISICAKDDGAALAHAWAELDHVHRVALACAARHVLRAARANGGRVVTLVHAQR